LLRRHTILLLAGLLSHEAAAQQPSFVGRWAGDVPGVGGAVLVITQVRSDGRVEGRMEFQLHTHASSFGEKFEPATNTSRGIVQGSALVIESSLGGLYNLNLEGGTLAGTFSRGTTYQAAVRFARQ
jgi:hypothetical protein